MVLMELRLALANTATDQPLFENGQKYRQKSENYKSSLKTTASTVFSRAPSLESPLVADGHIKC